MFYAKITIFGENTRFYYRIVVVSQWKKQGPSDQNDLIGGENVLFLRLVFILMHTVAVAGIFPYGRGDWPQEKLGLVIISSKLYRCMHHCLIVMKSLTIFPDRLQRTVQYTTH